MLVHHPSFRWQLFLKCHEFPLENKLYAQLKYQNYEILKICLKKSFQRWTSHTVRHQVTDLPHSVAPSFCAFPPHKATVALTVTVKTTHKVKANHQVGRPLRPKKIIFHLSFAMSCFQ